MAIEITAIASNLDIANLTSYSTSSVSPVDTQLALLAVENRIATGVSGGPQTPTVSGCNLTWVQVATLLGSGATPNRRATLFRAFGPDPTTGQLTISFGSETQTHCGYALMQFANTLRTGANGSGAIVQSATANDGGVLGTTATVTLASAPSSPNNLTYAFAYNTGPATITAGTGFTIWQTGSESENGTYFITETQLAAQTASCTWTGNNSWFILAVELAAAPLYRAPFVSSKRPRPFAPGLAR